MYTRYSADLGTVNVGRCGFKHHAGRTFSKLVDFGRVLNYLHPVNALSAEFWKIFELIE